MQRSPEAAVRETQSDVVQRTVIAPLSSSNDLLYIANAGNNSITVYPYNASGNTAPLRIISGSNTGLSSPGQLSEDADGNLYVLNTSNYGTAPAAVLVFPHGANGNVAPIRAVFGPLTGLSYPGGQVRPTGMTVDQTTGKLYVMVGEDQASYLLRFPPNPNGDEVPFAFSSEFGYYFQEMANDSTGEHLIMPALTGSDCLCLVASVVTVADQFADYRPDSFFQMPLPCNGGGPYNCAGSIGGVADDPTTKTFIASTALADGSTNIQRFAEGDTSFTPLSTIKKVTCVGQLALGYLRNIYDLCSSAVYVYEHDSSGSVAPLRILTGPATKLDKATGIYEGL